MQESKQRQLIEGSKNTVFGKIILILYWGGQNQQLVDLAVGWNLIKLGGVHGLLEIHIYAKIVTKDNFLRRPWKVDSDIPVISKVTLKVPDLLSLFIELQ